ncbi:hypothetical protein [Vibrio palustris]|uniref:Uncharacterized protein n=1 Tax=Vibrio palustris TaxID=1918946 RepID=A0A1R4B6I6_9VIBR|nr:hypothetical protein [Vibrio palustris]SJL84528.1 hypothetical protein VPAL9027_02517 [Vibrio palustris]
MIIEPECSLDYKFIKVRSRPDWLAILVNVINHPKADVEAVESAKRVH